MDRPSPEDAARLVDDDRFANAVVAILAGLTINGAWRSEEKWLLRRLRDTDPAMADRFVLALRAHQGGDAEPVITFAEQVLELSGGPLFDGYRVSGKPLIAGLEPPEGNSSSQ